MRKVSVRELRQNLSVYLREVERGQSFTVLSRGRPVAALGPVSKTTSRWDQLVAEGKLIPASRPWDERPVPLPAEGDRPLSEILDEIREDRV